MTAITVTMRSTTQRQDSGTTAGHWQRTARPRNGLHVTEPSCLLSTQATCLSGVNFLLKTGDASRDWAHNPLETGREAPAFRPLFCPVLFLIWTHAVYLKNSVSHITRSFPRQDVTGDGGFFFWSPRVNLNVEVKQTPDEAVAGRQPAL